MSGVAGADRVKSRQDYQQFINSYKQLLSKFPGFVSIQPSGSYNSDLNKNDFGDIDLITHIKSTKNKKEVKLELVHFFEKQPDTTIVAFTSDKHAGRRTYNSGEIVTVRYHDHHLGYSAQIDNIIALDHIEAKFKQDFLDMPAEKQGLVLGLVKIATVETDPKLLFAKLNIKVPLNLQPNQEFEFNLSSNELQLRKVTYEPGTFKQVDREILWTSKNYGDLAKLLYQYDLSQGFEELLAQAHATIKNPRSKNRMQGVFGSMITVKSGEVGTAKGANKVAALDKIKNTFAESRVFNALVENTSNAIVMAFGRFQPPTKGHQALVDAVKKIAQQHKCGYVIYASRTQDKKKNPLPIDSKMGYLHEMFPGTQFVAANDQVRTPIEAVKHLNEKYSNIIMVAGADRATTFQELLNKYNGVEFKYHTATVVSSGERDPDSDSIEGVSGTKVREFAVAGDFNNFKANLPNGTSDQTAERLMKELQGLIGAPKAPKAPKPTAEKQDMMAGVGLMPNENWDSGGSDEAGKAGQGGAGKNYVSYREPQFREGWSDRIVAQRTGRPRTPYSVYIKGKKWKDFENDDHAEAVANKLRAKLKADGRDPNVITIAPTDYEKGVAEAHDPKFAGFMNQALGTRQDKKPLRVDPKTVMSMNNMPGYKHAFKFGMDIIKKMDPDTKEHFANEDDDALESYMIDIAEKKGFIPKYFVEEDLSEVVGEFEEIFHDPEMEGWSWADLLRDMIGQEPRAHEKANVQAHKQMMAKAQAEKDNPPPIDPNKLQVVDRTDTGKSEIWYPSGGFFGTDSWAVVQDGFKDKAHAEHALKQLKANPNVVNIIKKAIADEGLAEGGGAQQAAIAIAKRESGKYTKDGKRKK